MTRILAAYAAILVPMVALDLLWLGLIAKPMYQQGIGHLMADQPRLPVAVLFYFVYAAGLMTFSVVAQGATAGWRPTLQAAALFGFFAYATYDLTNLATLKNWPASLAAIDIAWGVFVSTASAAAGRAAWVGMGRAG
jgi:uncharacterized membrane protein